MELWLAAALASHRFDCDFAAVADLEIHRIDHLHVPDLGHIFSQLDERTFELHGDFGNKFNAFDSAEIQFYVFVAAVKFQGVVAGRCVLDINHGNIENFFIHRSLLVPGQKLLTGAYFSRKQANSQTVATLGTNRQSAAQVFPFANQEIPDGETIDFYYLFCYKLDGEQ
jgi:hypothetical protein